jgi:outer membrane beta-barrel protein
MESLRGALPILQRQILSLRILLKISLFVALTNLGADFVSAEEYHRATELEENVKNKLFPKNGKFEVSGPSVGTYLNQSYVDTYFLHMSFNYYWNENWGFGFEGLYAQNTDRPERFCIENFYNDPNEQIGTPCPGSENDLYVNLKYSNDTDIPGASFGPAYTNVREINAILAGTLIWNPIYGKQLAFLSFTTYFDIFTTLGLGATLSTFYPQSLKLRNGVLARGPVDEEEIGRIGSTCDTGPGVCASDPNVQNLIGVAGRPDPEDQITPTLILGIGQKIHFKERFHIKAEIRNYSLLGTENGIDTFLALQLGVGVRF